MNKTVSTSRSPRSKLFRDPVHNVITFDPNDRVDALLLRLIQTPQFQRLRRIAQLGMANLVFHGAEHSRFQHSIGVMHVARRIANKLGLDEEDRMEVLCAALLHDVGHGPFSHAIEHVTHIFHEEFTRQLIIDPGSDIFKVLSEASESLPGRLSRYFEKQTVFPPHQRVLKDIVSSQLDADRMDYLQRDAHATGVRLGLFDFERILAMLTVSDIDGVTRLAVNIRAREAVEGYLLARAHMYKLVYLHKAVRAAENMLQMALELGRRYICKNEKARNQLDPVLVKLLQHKKIHVLEYATLDDTNVWMAFKIWANSDQPELAELSRALLNRNLYKTYNIDVSDHVSAGRLSERARLIAEELGFNPDHTVFVDNAHDTPYRPYSPDRVSNPIHICLVDDHGHHVPIEEVSDMARLLGADSYKITRLIVHPLIRPRLDETIKVIGGVSLW